MNTHNAIAYDVEHVIPLTDKVLRIFLTPSGNEDLNYQAGQYVELGFDQHQARPFSIANAPLGGRQLEFHIRHGKDDPFTDSLLEKIRSNHRVFVYGPHGHCTYDATQQPLLFLAAGTGFAPMKALIESILAQGNAPEMHLIWGANKASDFYLDDIPKQWAAHLDDFHYLPVIKNIDGPVYDCVSKQIKNVSPYQTYCAGPFDFVQACFDALTKLGLPRDAFHSDLLS